MNNEYELVMIITTFYQVPDIRVLSTGSFVLPSNCMRKYYKSHVEKGALHQEKGQLVWLGSGSMGGGLGLDSALWLSDTSLCSLVLE